MSEPYLTVYQEVGDDEEWEWRLVIHYPSDPLSDWKLDLNDFELDDCRERDAETVVAYTRRLLAGYSARRSQDGLLPVYQQRFGLLPTVDQMKTWPIEHLPVPGAP